MKFLLQFYVDLQAKSGKGEGGTTCLAFVVFCLPFKAAVYNCKQGATTVSILTLSIMTFSTVTFSTVTFSIATFSIATFSIATFGIPTFNIMTLCTSTLSIMTLYMQHSAY